MGKNGSHKTRFCPRVRWCRGRAMASSSEPAGGGGGGEEFPEYQLAASVINSFSAGRKRHYFTNVAVSYLPNATATTAEEKAGGAAGWTGFTSEFHFPRFCPS